MLFDIGIFKMRTFKSRLVIFGHNGNEVLVDIHFLSRNRKLMRAIAFLVHNWTTEDVVHWLVNHVNLPMYVDNFRRNQFDGRMIPR